MKPFNLEQALAGEPVKLRNGLKAHIKYVLPEQYKDDYPLRGFLLNLKGKISETAWTMQGTHSIFEQNTGFDVIGMWEEPRPRVQLDLPCPIAKVEDKNVYSLTILLNTFNDGELVQSTTYEKGVYFTSKSDALEWLDAMKEARR